MWTTKTRLVFRIYKGSHVYPGREAPTEITQQDLDIVIRAAKNRQGPFKGHQPSGLQSKYYESTPLQCKKEVWQRQCRSHWEKKNNYHKWPAQISKETPESSVMPRTFVGALKKYICSSSHHHGSGEWGSGRWVSSRPSRPFCTCTIVSKRAFEPLPFIVALRWSTFVVKAYNPPSGWCFAPLQWCFPSCHFGCLKWRDWGHWRGVSRESPWLNFKKWGRMGDRKATQKTGCHSAVRFNPARCDVRIRVLGVFLWEWSETQGCRTKGFGGNEKLGGWLWLLWVCDVGTPHFFRGVSNHPGYVDVIGQWLVNGKWHGVQQGNPDGEGCCLDSSKILSLTQSLVVEVFSLGRLVF